MRARGDAALLEYTQRFDRVALSAADLAMRREEYAAAERAVGEVTLALAALRGATASSASTASALQRSWRMRDDDGTLLGQEVPPLDRVGIYVPGGKAAYPSTVLMTAVPAQVAGVRRDRDGLAARRRRRAEPRWCWPRRASPA